MWLSVEGFAVVQHISCECQSSTVTMQLEMFYIGLWPIKSRFVSKISSICPSGVVQFEILNQMDCREEKISSSKDCKKIVKKASSMQIRNVSNNITQYVNMSYDKYHSFFHSNSLQMLTNVLKV